MTITRLVLLFCAKQSIFEPIIGLQWYLLRLLLNHHYPEMSESIVIFYYMSYSHVNQNEIEMRLVRVFF